MKKLLVIAAMIFITACNNSETKTETTGIDSSEINKETTSHDVIDTAKKMMNKAKGLVDSAAKKMERAVDKLKSDSSK